jgi:hypothetical protein
MSDLVGSATVSSPVSDLRENVSYYSHAKYFISHFLRFYVSENYAGLTYISDMDIIELFTYTGKYLFQ